MASMNDTRSGGDNAVNGLCGDEKSAETTELPACRSDASDKVGRGSKTNDPALPVKIITDSTCDLTNDILLRYNIKVVPLYVTLDKESLLDGVQVGPADLYAYHERTKRTPKTSAPTVGDFVAAFEPIVRQGREIVFIGISESMSATLSNARTAAAEFSDAVIRCVDSKSLSTGVGMAVVEACELAALGLCADDIAAKLEGVVKRVRASFVLDTLTYLYHGGRCSAVQNIGSMLLKLKPRIEVIGGAMSPTEKYRGSFVGVARQYAQSVLAVHNTGKSGAALDNKRAFITSSLNTDPAAIEAAAEEVRFTGLFDEVIRTQAGCVITSHCGPNTIGVITLSKA